MTDKTSKLEHNEIIKRIEEELLPVLEKSINDDSTYFYNKNLIKCREKKQCNKENCPVSDVNLRCWQVAGTYCGNTIQGEFAQKYQSCKECEVFEAACPTIVERLGEGLNNMLFLIRKEKGLRKQHLKKIEHLNKELISSLENLDSRNREIQELIITDKLTGLYNRHFMMTTLEDEINRSSRTNRYFSLLMIDLDDFKKINDTYGHINGDLILSMAGKIITTNIRKYDRAFRYGGEEFIIVLPETDINIAWMVAERIREKFAREQITIQDSEKQHLISATLSIGVVGYEKGEALSQMLKRADEAMYTAKSLGKNKVVRYEEITL